MKTPSSSSRKETPTLETRQILGFPCFKDANFAKMGWAENHPLFQRNIFTERENITRTLYLESLTDLLTHIPQLHSTQKNPLTW
jgi:hypothetical protein